MSNETNQSSNSAIAPHRRTECSPGFCGWPTLSDDSALARDTHAESIRITASQGQGSITASTFRISGGPQETVHLAAGQPSVTIYDGRTYMTFTDQVNPSALRFPPVSKAVTVARLRALADLIEATD